MTHLHLVWSKPEPIHDHLGALTIAHLNLIAACTQWWMAVWGMK